jgi:hypothetical protein
VKGYAIAERPSIEILAAGTSSQDDIESVAATPGWQVIYSFYLPTTVPLRLEMHGAVSVAGLTMRARFFDLADNVPLTDSYAVITDTNDTRATSGLMTLQGLRSYQIQVEVTGADGGFGTVRGAAPTV